METNKKTIGNAMIAYFMLFICITFFLNKENKYINNDFVKSHVLTAFFLHILFLLVYIVFISFNIGRSIDIFGISLNNIIASGIFIGLFSLLMYGMYKAHKGERFTYGDILTLTKTENIMSSNTEEEISEQDKIKIILAYIPFIGFFTYGRDITSPYLTNIVQLNLIISLCISFSHISGAHNLGIFISLLYILFVVYCAVTLIIKDEVVVVSMKRIPTPTHKYIWLQTLIPYIWNHIGEKETDSLESVYQEKKLKYYESEKQRQEAQKQKKKFPLPLLFIYIPFVNIIALLFVKSQYKYHIISSFFVSLLMGVSFLIFGKESLVPVLGLFPLSFAFGYKQRLGYQIPFVYDIYSIFAGISYKITHIFSTGRKIQKTVKQEKISLEQQKSTSEKEKIQ